jgi:translation elongation factor P/translation initiation factor 5A
MLLSINKPSTIKTMYKVQRQPKHAGSYEVMLSPFRTKSEVVDYYNKYSKYYPEEDRTYLVMDMQTNNQITINPTDQPTHVLQSLC